MVPDSAYRGAQGSGDGGRSRRHVVGRCVARLAGRRRRGARRRALHAGDAFFLFSFHCKCSRISFFHPPKVIPWIVFYLTHMRGVCWGKRSTISIEMNRFYSNVTLKTDRIKSLTFLCLFISLLRHDGNAVFINNGVKNSGVDDGRWVLGRWWTAPSTAWRPDRTAFTCTIVATSAVAATGWARTLIRTPATATAPLQIRPPYGFAPCFSLNFCTSFEEQGRITTLRGPENVRDGNRVSMVFLCFVSISNREAVEEYWAHVANSVDWIDCHCSTRAIWAISSPTKAVGPCSASATGWCASATSSAGAWPSRSEPTTWAEAPAPRRRSTAIRVQCTFFFFNDLLFWFSLAIQGTGVGVG